MCLKGLPKIKIIIAAPWWYLYWYFPAPNPSSTLIWTWPQIWAGGDIVSPHPSHWDQSAPQVTLSHLRSCSFFPDTLLSHQRLLSLFYPLWRLFSVFPSASLPWCLMSLNSSLLIMHFTVFKIFSHNSFWRQISLILLFQDMDEEKGSIPSSRIHRRPCCLPLSCFSKQCWDSGFVS